jgi:hypothetical protein
VESQYVERVREHKPRRLTTETQADVLGREHAESEASLTVDLTHGMQEGDTGQSPINFDHPMTAAGVFAQLLLLGQPAIRLMFRHRTCLTLMPEIAFDGRMPTQPQPARTIVCFHASERDSRAGEYGNRTVSGCRTGSGNCDAERHVAVGADHADRDHDGL